MSGTASKIYLGPRGRTKTNMPHLLSPCYENLPYQVPQSEIRKFAAALLSAERGHLLCEVFAIRLFTFLFPLGFKDTIASNGTGQTFEIANGICWL